MEVSIGSLGEFGSDRRPFLVPLAHTFWFAPFVDTRTQCQSSGGCPVGRSSEISAVEWLLVWPRGCLGVFASRTEVVFRQLTWSSRRRRTSYYIVVIGSAAGLRPLQDPPAGVGNWPVSACY